MKSYIFAGIITTLSFNSFAVQDQLNFAKLFMVKNGQYNGSVQSSQLLNQQSSSLLVEKKGTANPPQESKYVEISSDIKLGQKNPAIAKLQNQLEMESTGVYNKELQDIIKEGQKQWGMNVTGTIDENTWFAFYQQPMTWQYRVAQEAASEWQTVLDKHAQSENSKMIVVNIPSQTLMLYEKSADGYKFIMSSPVVVGTKRKQTPFDDLSIISLKYNPNWTPTPSMIKNNLYKGGELNLKWLQSHGIMALNEEGESVPFEDIEPGMKLRYVQPSGDDNALGLLKFETNSKDNIYLHDTNEKGIFGYNTRIYSSGCIRVKEYMKLASLIAEKPAVKIKEKIDKGDTVFEKTPKTPVYFTYSQVIYDVNGIPMYFADSYGKRKHNKENWQ